MLFIAGAGMRRTLCVFFFVIELEDGGAPADAVLSEVWLAATQLPLGESVDLA